MASSFKEVSGNVTAPKGFRAAGVHCGIKKEKRDLALIFSDSPCVAAAMFTTNKVKAASVIVNKAKLAKSGGIAQAIVVNSGNANACTGVEGKRNAEKTAELAGKTLRVDEESVLICSTGIIGKQLPMDAVEKGILEAAVKLKSEATDAAEAIMTTDTKQKEIAVEFSLSKKTVRIGAIAKGVGMINPNMATMLCFITTDTDISKEALDSAIREVVIKTFNSITVDGDMSTNDTCIILANKAAGNQQIKTASGADYETFRAALDHVCRNLAKRIVLDGEGATKFITISVTGAADDSEAAIIAKSVANSALVKTAMFGQNPNWGRVICAVGYAKTKKEFDAEGAVLTFNKVKVYDGKAGPTGANVSLAGKEIEIEIALSSGKGRATVYTCDFSYEYVKINAEYN